MANNLAEYQTPEIYDAEYGSFKDDLHVFLGLKHQGSALDLACGTGRLTIALAKSGLSCVGLDASDPMLTRAKTKSEGLDISYTQRDMTNFQLNQTFDLITLAGNAFQALLSNEDQDNLFASVKAHLNSDGIFAFNTRNLRPDDKKISTDYVFWHDFIDPSGQLVKVFGKQVYNSSKNTVCYTTKRIWPDTEAITDIELRFTSLEDLEHKLRISDFEVINRYGDFHKDPFVNSSPNIILICRLK